MMDVHIWGIYVQFWRKNGILDRSNICARLRARKVPTSCIRLSANLWLPVSTPQAYLGKRVIP